MRAKRAEFEFSKKQMFSNESVALVFCTANLMIEANVTPWIATVLPGLQDPPDLYVAMDIIVGVDRNLVRVKTLR